MRVFSSAPRIRIGIGVGPALTARRVPSMTLLSPNRAERANRGSIAAAITLLARGLLIIHHVPERAKLLQICVS